MSSIDPVSNLTQSASSMAPIVVGNYLDKKASDKSRRQARRNYNNEYNYRKMMDFHGIKIRVNDAINAGIHPLAALGANINSYSALNDTNQPYHSSGSAYKDAIQAGLNAKNKKKLQLQSDQLHDANLKNVQADIALKQAEASLIAKQAQEVNSAPRDLFVKAMDNNPDSATYGEQIWLVDPELAEGMEGIGALSTILYGNMQGRPGVKKKTRHKGAGKIIKRGKGYVIRQPRTLKSKPAKKSNHVKQRAR